jgi:hypothetical protein
VFNTADKKVLEQAIELDESLAGQIVEIKDDYAVGPLMNIYEVEGYQQRRDWWKNVLQYSPYEDQINIVDDKQVIHDITNAIEHDPEQTIWIWMGQNAHDVSGYYWVMSQFKEYQGRMQVLYLNNLPFINEKGLIFYPSYLSEILPKEFVKAKKLARPITLSEFELDPDEWKKICNEEVNDLVSVRFLEGGKKIVNKPIDFFDKDIVSLLTKNAQKLNSALTTLLSKMKVKTGDAFIVWRLQQLAQEGKVILNGNWEKGWKDIVVLIPGGSTTITE